MSVLCPIWRNCLNLRYLSSLNTRVNFHYHTVRVKHLQISEINCRVPKARLKSSVVHNDFEDDETLSKDEEEFNIWRKELYKIDGIGHRVYLIQPNPKWIPEKKRNTTPKLQLDEAAALAETLPNWSVIEKRIVTVKEPKKKLIFSSGILEELTDLIKSARLSKGASALFIGLDMLTGLQHAELEKHFGLPVYDRYMIVLRIFHDHARTKEARLQIALAEIPYIRSRMRGMLTGTIDRMGGSSMFRKGSGETFLEARKRILTERESKIKNSIAQLKSRRVLLRENRMKKQFPIVAVVGYTNAGKTTLIKALTGEKELQPKDQLFATLDVTAHAGTLPNRMTVLYIDTVGFIQDIPTALIHSFAATLEDVLLADLIIHVSDISHPDYLAQKETVYSTLQSINVEKKLIANMIEVDSKIDLLPKDRELSNDTNALRVSFVTSEGVRALNQEIQKKILHPESNKFTVHFRVLAGGKECSWLHKEANVVNAVADEDDPQFHLVQTIITKSVLSKFRHRFGNLEVDVEI